MNSLRSLWTVLLFAILLGSADAGNVVLRTFDREDYSGTVTLEVGGALCRIEFQGSGRWLDACRFPAPKDARELSLSGEFRFTDYKNGPQKRRGTQKFQILDLAPLLATLRDSTKSFGQRVGAFIAAEKKLRNDRPDLEDTPLHVEARERPAALPEIQAAQKRIGFELPSEHSALLMEIGGFDLDDSYTTPADGLAITYQILSGEWHEPAERMAGLSPKTVDIYKSSVILFTEVGDGLGALLYQPAAKAPCDGQSGYYYMHQEDAIDEPELLKNQRGACRSYQEVLVWLFATQAMTAYDDLAREYFVIDSSSKASIPAGLFHDDGGGLGFRVFPEWAAIE